ncbi:MAG: hypothetical protein AB8G77_27595 [Rhodothermales bacterium]
MSTNGEIKMSFVSTETMDKDLQGGGRRGRVNPMLDKVIEKVQKINGKPLQLEVTPQQRTGILGKLKKMGLLSTRKDPDRKYTAKFKIVSRDDKNKPEKIRMYIFENKAA